MTDKQMKDEFRYADGTNEQENYESFINSFDIDDEVYYRGKHYIKFMKEQLKAKEQECEELKERVKTKCFDPKNKNNRCISYNRISQDYEIDLIRLNKYKQALNDIKYACQSECIEGNTGYVVDTSIILDIINDLEKEK